MVIDHTRGMRLIKGEGDYLYPYIPWFDRKEEENYPMFFHIF
jgi:hypothetical protein